MEKMKITIVTEYEIDNCPLCGAQPEIIDRTGAHMVRCSVAKHSDKSYHCLVIGRATLAQAIAEWNRLECRRIPPEVFHL